MPDILIVDDEAGMRFALREILEAEGYRVDEADNGKAALARLDAEPAALVLSDLSMPVTGGMALLRALQERPEAPPLVMLTARGSERHAVEAMKLGAFDYLTKPFDMDELLLVVAKVMERTLLARENRKLRAELALGRKMVFASPAMLAVADAVERIAGRDVTILITGESGTGKELVADAIHHASGRREKPFVRFSCAAVNDNLLEAAFFGHERGAFTGADRARPGCFRQANGGTLFLDEVGELSPLGQTRLLRVLQEGEIQPVGGAPLAVDVRVIAATNRDLRAEGFREDLFYRLNVVSIALPPLAGRREDIPLLVDHFFRKYAERFGLPELEVPDAIRERLIASPWPGNVRELENAVERLVAFSRDGVVEEVGGAPAPPAVAESLTLRQRVEAYERGQVKAALEATGQNQSEAARRLGVSRATLIDKMKKYGLR